MIDSLFDHKMEKKINKIELKQAKINHDKSDIVNEVMKKTSPETFKKVFELVKMYGHPEEKQRIGDIEDKYKKGNSLDFEDIVNMESLYKSNYKEFENKEIENE